VCRACRHPREVTDTERAWWLQHFDDETIAELASMLFGTDDFRGGSVLAGTPARRVTR
jgi:hypothetical protein